jgi:hypothetical protein
MCGPAGCVGSVGTLRELMIEASTKKQSVSSVAMIVVKKAWSLRRLAV